MEINGIVCCLFEQSGVFRDAFRSLGYEALCADIANDYGKTDAQLDLFVEIDKAYHNEPSWLDGFIPDDLLVAFFPCVYFNQHNYMFFNGTDTIFSKMSVRQRSDYILERSRLRHEFYCEVVKLFTICETRGLRLIVENPNKDPHFLKQYFPWKPAVIDWNRRRRGDYFEKPTQYWFINCKPTSGFSRSSPPEIKTVDGLPGHHGSKCDPERSLISPVYARNFICDFILGKVQENTEPTLF